ncbi:hypothetical protein [Nannocystis exedens]|nr:hypothetical protein [Nannocystis exedens]
MTPEHAWIVASSVAAASTSPSAVAGPSAQVVLALGPPRLGGES